MGGDVVVGKGGRAVGIIAATRNATRFGVWVPTPGASRHAGARGALLPHRWATAPACDAKRRAQCTALSCGARSRLRQPPDALQAPPMLPRGPPRSLTRVAAQSIARNTTAPPAAHIQHTLVF
jgi:hypothetical protein